MITRTKDYRIVKKLASWQPIISNEVIYLTEDNAGLWAFHEHLDGLMIHAEMGVNCRGKAAIESAKRAFDWIFKNTDKTIIYAAIPKERKAACYMARWSGMKFTHEDDKQRYYEVSHGVY